MNHDDDLDRYFDRRRAGLTPEDVAAMEARLSRDDAFRTAYVARARMESDLATIHQRGAVFPTVRPPIRRRWPGWSVALAAAACLAVAILWLTRSARSETVAVLESSSHASWVSDFPSVPGSELGAGRMRLVEGTATLRFRSGVVATLEGPVDVRLISADRCELGDGAAKFEVPPGAEGFVVETSGGHAVDLGTSFVMRSRGGRAEFAVIEGEVRLHHRESGQTQTLMTGQRSAISAAGLEEPSAVAGERPLPVTPGTVRRSARRAVSVVRNNEPGFLEPQLLMVKLPATGESAGSERRALFEIESAGLDLDQLKIARLHLNVVPSGRGFSSVVGGDTLIAVYGLKGSANDDWTDDGLAWEDAPAWAPEGLAEDELVLLGKVRIEKGRTSGRLALETDALRDFLRQDHGARHGFLLVCETQADITLSLVHAFAAPGHPEAAGPSLEFRF